MAGARWPRFLPDLTYWYSWHFSHDTLPGPWRNKDLSSICRELGVSEWRIVRPWRIELPGIEVERHQGAEEKTVTWKTGSGTLRARWILGPDGDWWQAEYPVKTARGPRRGAGDRERAKVHRRAFANHGSRGRRRSAHRGAGAAAKPPAGDLSCIPGLVGRADALPGGARQRQGARGDPGRQGAEPSQPWLPACRAACAILPDNLDGRFITPDTFADSLAPLYSFAAATPPRGRKRAGRPRRRPDSSPADGLAGCGVDCAEGVCGAPQGDSTLAEARAACGPGMTLWGGIAQDVLLETSTRDEFQAAARTAFADAARDPGAVVGVADRVPVDAVPERLAELARLARESGPREA